MQNLDYKILELKPGGDPQKIEDYIESSNSKIILSKKNRATDYFLLEINYTDTDVQKRKMLNPIVKWVKEELSVAVLKNDIWEPIGSVKNILPVPKDGIHPDTVLNSINLVPSLYKGTNYIRLKHTYSNSYGTLEFFGFHEVDNNPITTLKGSWTMKIYSHDGEIPLPSALEDNSIVFTMEENSLFHLETDKSNNIQSIKEK